VGEWFIRGLTQEFLTMIIGLISEGVTDHLIIDDIISGLLRKDEILVNPVRPIGKEPFGWGNLFQFLKTNDFENSLKLNDFVVIQIDTDVCLEWPNCGDFGLTKLVDKNSNDEDHENILDKIKAYLIGQMNKEIFYKYENKIVFAVSINSIECWLLPLNASLKAHQNKIVNCLETLNLYLSKKGETIDKENKTFKNNRIYEGLSKPFRNYEKLQSARKFNYSLNHFCGKLETTIT
jgi:hypothetical protein